MLGLRSPNQGLHHENSIIETPSLSVAIKVLEQTTEAFEDMPLYLFSIKLLKDPNKRKNFMSICHDRRVHYLYYYYGNQDTTIS
ncbi:hypothetical protein IEQ34_006132 [Dendrobium chrysotoxum]|uniref:Uncharacterized protein n=1 Tax=Dendrobium chrysotoxum TaxID=161865 RepID=A0AAV7HD75_DENCH|nr:hypothetical protein IEQ34_006132 [Dendrobium chrysotoxum]